MEIFTKINWVDILVIIIVLRSTYVAFQDGLSHEIIPLVGAFLSLAISLKYSRDIAFIVHQNMVLIPVGIFNSAIFLGIFICVIFVFRLIKVIFDLIVKLAWHPAIEKSGGLIVGFVKSSLFASAILITLVLLPASYLRWSINERSLTGKYFVRIGAEIYLKTSGFLPTIKIEGRTEEPDDMTQALLSSSGDEKTK